MTFTFSVRPVFRVNQDGSVQQLAERNIIKGKFPDDFPRYTVHAAVEFKTPDDRVTRGEAEVPLKAQTLDDAFDEAPMAVAEAQNRLKAEITKPRLVVAK